MNILEGPGGPGGPGNPGSPGEPEIPSGPYPGMPWLPFSPFMPGDPGKPWDPPSVCVTGDQSLIISCEIKPIRKPVVGLKTPHIHKN